MRFIHLYLVGYFIVVLGIGLALWQTGVLGYVAPIWVGVKAPIAVPIPADQRRQSPNAVDAQGWCCGKAHSGVARKCPILCRRHRPTAELRLRGDQILRP